MALTYREARYVRSRLQGKSSRQALLDAGFSESLADNPALIVSDEMKSEVARLQAELVAHTLDGGLIDAQEIHEYLTDALRADMRDIRNDDGSFKPQSEWPEIWGRMCEAGDCEVEYTYDRSTDGEHGENRAGWDKSGEVKKVKLKFSSKIKLLELAMKHKGVNAYAPTNFTPQGENVPMFVFPAGTTIDMVVRRTPKAIEAAAEDDADIVEIEPEAEESGE